MRTIGHIKPDMTLSRAEIAADKAAWKALEDESAKRLERVRAWEKWYEEVVADFAGLTTDSSDPDMLHDWEWMDDNRPAPAKL